MSATVHNGSVAVIVVSHCSAASIDDCLMRLRAAEGVTEIRVVDNASDDASVNIVQRHAAADPRLRFIANPNNPGFAVACNQGAANSHAPWLAFVNPDCLLEPDSLARLQAQALTCAETMALIGADLVDEDGVRDPAARRRDPNFGLMIASLLRVSSATAIGVPMQEAGTLQRVDAISGALMLMPRSLFECIGGFDEAYRLHAEDLDLCRRVREAGGAVAVANDVRVVHLRGVSSRARPLFVEWHKHRGLWRYFRKFEASRRGIATRSAVWSMIWLRFPFAALRAWFKAQR